MDPLLHDDPFIWLENLEEKRVTDWIEQHNRATLDRLCDQQFETDKDEILKVLDSPDLIPIPTRRGDYLYNFWRDAEHSKGIWRRTSEASYRSSRPDWDILLDVDELAKIEAVNWVYGGASFAPDNPSRALIFLSRSGGDTRTAREYDLETRSFVEADAFIIPDSKSFTCWIDADTLLIASNINRDEQTASEYARVVKRWHRGTGLDQAEIVFEGEYSDVYVYAEYDYQAKRTFFLRRRDFFTTDVFVEEHEGKRLELNLPGDASVAVKNGWLTLRPRQDYVVDGRRYLAGSLLIIDWLAFKGGGRKFTRLFTPEPRKSLSSVSWAGTRLAISVQQDLIQSFHILSFKNGKWRGPTMTLEQGQSGYIWPLDAADLAHLNTDSNNSGGQYLMRISGYLRPPVLFQLTPGQEPEQLRALPEFFDNSGMTVSLHHATSTDGVQIPYMQICSRDLVYPAPLLLRGYGGFEVSFLPEYSALNGKLWLEKGGIYVVACIRGGGEFGPAWHEAGRRQGKIRSHDDFAAVARDLIARGVTTCGLQACQGGSNGGLLVGAMLARYPELFAAVVCQMPLLDMFRYTKLPPGASWIAEYGDPENPRDWEYMRELSPYHLLRRNADYPQVLLTTSASDDRVHPGHARKMAAKMEALGYAPLFHETRDGGHAGAADNDQLAFNSALVYSFLRMTVLNN